LYPQAKIKTLIFFFFVTIARIPALYYLGFWFLYQLVMGLGALFGASPSVAFWAHIGGWVYGMVVVKALSVKPGKKQISESEQKSLLASEERQVRPITGPWVLTPLVDVLIEDDKLTVLANIPGVEERDINIQVTEHRLVISAGYRDIKFYREADLPVSVIPKPVNLMYRNGVLSFTLYRVL
jgi:HSP20 family molecular chaperone IbpA